MRPAHDQKALVAIAAAAMTGLMISRAGRDTDAKLQVRAQPRFSQMMLQVRREGRRNYGIRLRQ